MGGAFGLFLSGLDSPVTSEKMTARQTLRDMGQKSKSYAKNFALIGLMFAGTECLFETVSLHNNYHTQGRGGGVLFAFFFGFVIALKLHCIFFL